MVAGKDNSTALVAVGAVALAGVGIFLAVKAGEKRTARPGDTILARFIFDYNGTADSYVLQVSFGDLILGIFDHREGMIWSKTYLLPGPGHYTKVVECLLPLGTASGPYDAEALIKIPGMSLLQYIVKSNVARAIEVEAV